MNLDSPIVDQLAAILLNIETITEILQNSVNDNRSANIIRIFWNRET